MNIGLNLTDGNNHKVTLYLVDWDSSARRTRVDILDARTQQVLATQSVSSFHNGVHLKWDLRGNVIVRLTGTGGPNAVISGLFFDGLQGSQTPALSGKVTAGGGKGYDVLFVSSPFVEALAHLGLIAELDHANIPNLANLYPEAQTLAYDEGNRHSVPYAWGTTGLCYRSDLVAAAPTSWLDLLKPAQLEKGEQPRLNDWDAARLHCIEEESRGRWQIHGDAGLKALARRLLAAGAPAVVEQPPGLGMQLRGYQLLGLAWLQHLREHNLCGILADDMGLGKTAQALAHIWTEKLAGRLDRPALVIVPTSLPEGIDEGT